MLTDKMPLAIYRARTWSKQSGRTIAKAINVSAGYYSQIENGSRPVTIKHLEKICAFYNVTVDQLLSLANEEVDVPTIIAAIAAYDSRLADVTT